MGFFSMYCSSPYTLCGGSCRGELSSAHHSTALLTQHFVFSIRLYNLIRTKSFGLCKADYKSLYSIPADYKSARTTNDANPQER